MRTCLTVAILTAALAAALSSDSVKVLQGAPSEAPRESRASVGKASLYTRDIGRGLPVIVLHGGPDFDHRYFLPDLSDPDESRAGLCHRLWRSPQGVLAETRCGHG